MVRVLISRRGIHFWHLFFDLTKSSLIINEERDMIPLRYNRKLMMLSFPCQNTAHLLVIRHVEELRVVKAICVNGFHIRLNSH